MVRECPAILGLVGVCWEDNHFDLVVMGQWWVGMRISFFPSTIPTTIVCVPSCLYLPLPLYTHSLLYLLPFSLFINSLFPSGLDQDPHPGGSLYLFLLALLVYLTFSPCFGLFVHVILHLYVRSLSRWVCVQIGRYYYWPNHFPMTSHIGVPCLQEEEEEEESCHQM